MGAEGAGFATYGHAGGVIWSTIVGKVTTARPDDEIAYIVC